MGVNVVKKSRISKARVLREGYVGVIGVKSLSEVEGDKDGVLC